MPIISMIVAMDPSGVIGVNNSLPWRIKEDMDHFRNVTRNRVVICGKKTFQSIGKLLPGRWMVVLTRSEMTEQGFGIAQDPVDAITKCYQNCPHGFYRDEFIVIGGSEVYRAFQPYVNKIHLTIIRKNYPGDSWFPMDIFDDRWIVQSIRWTKQCFFVELTKCLT